MGSLFYMGKMDFIIENKKAITIYTVVHLLTYIFFIKFLSKAHVKNNNNPKLAKYKPFARSDVLNWNIVTLAPFWITFWPRFVLYVLNTLFLSTYVVICMTGVDVKDPQLGPIRKAMLGTAMFICCRLHALIGGLYWVTFDYVSTEEGDYRKWLGPDWKPEWTGASTIVSNHVCWMDIVVSLAYF